jgi:hypothetical protein
VSEETPLEWLHDPELLHSYEQYRAFLKEAEAHTLMAAALTMRANAILRKAEAEFKAKALP